MASKYTYLYVLSCEEQKYLKIGICREGNVSKRLKHLQTGNPHPITLEWSEQRLDAHKAENYLHRCFQDYKIIGEWFEGITLKDIRRKLMMFHEQD